MWVYKIRLLFWGGGLGGTSETGREKLKEGRSDEQKDMGLALAVRKGPKVQGYVLAVGRRSKLGEVLDSKSS